MQADPLYDFIDTIFPEDLLTGHEHVCYWASKRQVPGFPVDESGLERALKSKRPQACYFGTSTVKLTDGTLRNRQTAFAGLWVIVLDDIGDGQGAKCPMESLPAGVWESASYRVETSPDNFQLGFVLDEPVRDLEAARELVRLIYNAGPWDSGGAMPTKLVRLPCGVNLKDKYKQNGEYFQVQLDHLDDAVFTPDELLSLVDAGVGWQDILDGESDKRDPRRGRGTTPYRGGAKMDLHGVVDPLLEWLNDNELILNERYPFVDILCPWHEEHTQGGTMTAGYSPLGWGEESFQAMRGFHCFHDHCKDRKAREFIEWAMGFKAPAVAVHDPIAPMVTRYALDCGSLEWVDIQSEDMQRVPDSGFQKLYAESVYFPKPGKVDEWAFAKTYKLLIENAGVLKVVGSCFDPGEGLIVERDRNNFINDCRLPFHGSGDINPVHVERFRDFFEYLVDGKRDAEWFIRHLAAKAQRPHYRGAAVFMHTPTHGTGRGTMGKLLGKLWGHQNVRAPSMKSMLKGLGGDGFNDQLRGLWLVVSESLEGEDTGPRVNSGHYESFKAFVEPAGTQITYNKKYGGQWTEMNYSSVIICSNHSHGMLISTKDRRVKRIQNTIERRDPDYFTTLHRWIDGDEWQSSVWQYLRHYDLGNYTGHEPIDHANDGDGEDMDDILAMQSPLDMTQALVVEYCEEHHQGTFNTSQVIDALHSDPGLEMKLGLHDMRADWRRMLRRTLNRDSRELRSKDRRVNVRGEHGMYKVRAFKTVVGAETLRDSDRGGWGGPEVKKACGELAPENLVGYIKQRLEALDLG